MGSLGDRDNVESVRNLRPTSWLWNGRGNQEIPSTASAQANAYYFTTKVSPLTNKYRGTKRGFL